MDWNSHYIADLFGAMEEDIGTGDATTARSCHREHRTGSCSRQANTRLRGIADCRKGLPGLDPEIRVTCPHNDGSFVEPGAEIVQMTEMPAQSSPVNEPC